MKRKVTFWVLFIMLLAFMYYMYRLFIYEVVYTFMISAWIDGVAILLFLIAIIPLTAFLSEKITSFAFRNGLEKGRNFGVFLTAMIVIPIILIAAFKFNEFKEKDLDDVISFRAANVDSIIVNDTVKTDKEKDAKTVKDLFSNYRVKKMNDREWDSDVSDQEGFTITIYANDKPIMASVYENRLSFYNNDSFYTVIDGPIDMDWVDEWYDEKEHIRE